MARHIVRFLGVTACLLAYEAVAQAPPPPQGTPMRVRGVVESLDGQTLMVNSREGQKLTIALAPNVAIASVLKRNLSDIKAGDYVASTSVRGTNGKLYAIEVHIFPEALRGIAEGQFPWDLVPDSIMTNATVAGVSAAPKGRVLKVVYKGTEAEVTVPDDVPVVTYGPGEKSLLKPGAAVFVMAQRGADGKLSAARVTAEKDGVKPPM